VADALTLLVEHIGKDELDLLAACQQVLPILDGKCGE
jgi:hypothetical protein